MASGLVPNTDNIFFGNSMPQSNNSLNDKAHYALDRRESYVDSLRPAGFGPTAPWLTATHAIPRLTEKY